MGYYGKSLNPKKWLRSILLSAWGSKKVLFAEVSINWTIVALIMISHELNVICWANCLVWWFCISYSLQGLPGQIPPQQHWQWSQEMMAYFPDSVSPLKGNLLNPSILLETPSLLFWGSESSLLWRKTNGLRKGFPVDFFALSLRTGAVVSCSLWSLWSFWSASKWLATLSIFNMFKVQRAKKDNHSMCVM